MAAVLSSRLVKHYSAPCRHPLSSLPSLCANSRSPSSSSFFVCTGLFSAPVSYARTPIQPRHPPTLWPVYCRKQGRSEKLQKKRREADASLADLFEVFIRSVEDKEPSLPSFSRPCQRKRLTMVPFIMKEEKVVFVIIFIRLDVPTLRKYSVGFLSLRAPANIY